ncbi:MAG: T9SS type A sorting domain-containing protein [Candidatus Kapaibacterium sp.]
MKRFWFLFAMALVLFFYNLGYVFAEPDEIVWLKTRNNLGLEVIINAVFTPDDLSIIVTDANLKTIEIDATTGLFKREIPNIRGVFRFSDDGQYVYTYDSKKVHFQTGEEIGQFKMNGVPVSGFTEWDINEKAGVLVGVFYHSQQHPTIWTNSIFIFDLNTFQLIDTIGIKDNYYSKIGLTGDGKYFRTFSKYNPDPTVETDDRYINMIWDTKLLISLFEKQELGNIKPSPDGRWLGSVAGNTVRVFDANTWEQRYEWKHDEQYGLLTAIDFSPDSRYLVTGPHEDAISGYTKYCVITYELNNGKENNVFCNDLSLFRSDRLSFNKSGTYILSSSTGKVILLNNLITSVGTTLPNNEFISIYPNPTSGEITIKSSDFKVGHLKLELTDIKGSSLKILYDRYYQNEELRFDISFLPTGTYFLKAIQNKLLQTYKIIKER